MNDTLRMNAHGPQRATPSCPGSRPPQAVLAALRSLTLPDPEVRRRNHVMLDDWQLSVSTLVELLFNASDSRVRAGACIRLGMEPPASERAAVIDALRAAIQDSNGHVSRQALTALKELHAVEAFDDSLAALADSDASVVIAATDAVGVLGQPESGAHLVPLLKRNDKRVQRAALRALRRLEYTAAVPPVLELLEAIRGRPRIAQVDYDVPHLAAAFLGAVRAAEAVPLLVKIVTEELGLRASALDALCQIRAPEAATALLPTLSAAFSDRHADDLALKMINLMALADYRAALPEVRCYLHHPNRILRIRAVEVVAAWGDAESAERIRELCYHDGSDFVRPVAARALAALLGPAAAPDLTQLANEINPVMRAAVAEALERIRATDRTP